MRLENRVAVITGASGGLGRAVTTAFLHAGARVAGVSRRIRNEDFPHTGFRAFPAELSSRQAASDLIRAVTAELGGFDIVVHLVGGWTGGRSIVETADAGLEEMLTLNLRSAFWVLQAALPGLRQSGRGRFIAIGSRAAVEPAPLSAAYGASKAALVSLVRSAAAENRDAGFTANIILPGTIDTAANRAAMPQADPSRWVPPATLASLAVWLAAEGAVNGAALPVFGGD